LTRLHLPVGLTDTFEVFKEVNFGCKGSNTSRGSKRKWVPDVPNLGSDWQNPTKLGGEKSVDPEPPSPANPDAKLLW